MARPATPNALARDTICAPATGAIASAIAIVRVSGPTAHAVADRLFRPHGGPASTNRVPGRLRHGVVSSPSGAAIDDGLCVLWIGPRSATGEDVAEFHVHGSPAVVAAVMEACVAAGARPAAPGEFTRRAFLNGRLDLAQAEAVALLAQSRTEAARRAALAQLSGGLSRILAGHRAALVGVLAQLEAEVDFPEDDVEAPLRGRLARALDGAARGIDALLATAVHGIRLHGGARVVLAGAPNAGKSSLLNALLGRERAIVSPHPGTTRDTIEATLELGGIPVTLVDTAGLREAPGDVEALGIDRARGELAAADLVLLVVDPREGTPPDVLAAIAGTPHIVVLNKADLAPPPSAESLHERLNAPGRVGWAVASATTGDGVAELAATVARALGAGHAPAAPDDPVICSTRHQAALRRAAAHIGRAQEALASALAPEFIAVDLVEAIGAIDSVSPTGRAAQLDEEVLDEIFSRFCLGK